MVTDQDLALLFYSHVTWEMLTPEEQEAFREYTERRKSS